MMRAKKKPAIDREAEESIAGQCPEGMGPCRAEQAPSPESGRR
jgi:hypothetical protein